MTFAYLRVDEELTIIPAASLVPSFVIVWPLQSRITFSEAIIMHSWLAPFAPAPPTDTEMGAPLRSAVRLYSPEEFICQQVETSTAKERLEANSNAKTKRADFLHTILFYTEEI